MKHNLKLLGSSLFVVGFLLSSCTKVDNKRNNEAYIGPAGQAGKDGADGKNAGNAPVHKKMIYIGAPFKKSTNGNNGGIFSCEFNNPSACQEKVTNAFNQNSSILYGSAVVATNDHVYIGAPNLPLFSKSHDKVPEESERHIGSVISCSLDLSVCQFAKPNRDLGDGTGSSLALYKDSLYIGAPLANLDPKIKKVKNNINKTDSNRSSFGDLEFNVLDTKGKDSLFVPPPVGFGAIYRCPLQSMQNCQVINYPKANYDSAAQGFKSTSKQVQFGSSLSVTKDGLFALAKFQDNSTASVVKQGALYRCGVDNNNCTELMLEVKNLHNVHLENGLHVTDKNIFIGISHANNSNSARVYEVLKCGLSDVKCEVIPKPTDINEHMVFGQSLSSDDMHLFVASISNSVGKIHKCNLEGKDCSKFIENTTDKYFGDSLFIR